MWYRLRSCGPAHTTVKPLQDLPSRLESVERSFLVFVDSNRDELHAVRVLRMLLR